MNRCIDCGDSAIATNDGKLCLKCLRKRIRQQTPDYRSPSDQIGRKQRSPALLGGAPDMKTTEQRADEDDAPV